MPGLLARFDERVVERVVEAAPGYAQRPAVAAPVIRPPVARLARFEVGQAVGVGPAGQIVLCLPPVIVQRMAAHVDHRIDRGRAPHHLAAGHVDIASVQRRFILGPVVPVDPGVAVDRINARWDVDQQVAIHRPGLKQKHSVAGLGQTVRHDAAGGACADDDVVEFHHGGRMGL